MANFLLIFYIASACIDSYASEHNMMRNFKLFLMPALMAYLSFHANHDFLLYIAYKTDKVIYFHYMLMNADVSRSAFMFLIRTDYS